MTKTPLQRIEEFLDNPNLDKQSIMIERMVKLEAALREAIRKSWKEEDFTTLNRIANILDGYDK